MSKRSNTRTLRAFQFFIEKGWKPHQASGIVGNLMQESGRNLDTTAVGDKGTAYGISQWRLDRQTGEKGLRAFAKERGAKASDFETQLEFVNWELQNTEKSAGQRLRRAGDVGQANDAMLHFLRPQGWKPSDVSRSHGRSHRLNFSQEVFGLAQGSPQIMQAAADNVRSNRMAEMTAETRQQMQQLGQTGSPNEGEGIVDAAQQRMAGSEDMQNADQTAASLDTGEYPEMQFSDLGFGEQPFQDFFADMPDTPEPPEPPMEGGSSTPRYKSPQMPSFEVDLPQENPNDRIPFQRMREMAASGPLGGFPPLPDPVPSSRREREQRHRDA